MAFASLLGNNRLKDNLTKSLSQGRISHFYLISGPTGSGKHTLAHLLAAAILCQSGNAPCLSCNICRRVMEDNHPDFITIDDKEHKAVSVKIVRQMREDVYIRPNESNYKIYLLPQELGIEGQNALLKILEEPPPYGVFLLLSNNPEQLLPTVRSRCTELSLKALPDTLLKDALQKKFPNANADSLNAAVMRSGGYLGQAQSLLEQENALPPQTEQFLTAFANQNTLELTKLLASMEKWKREQLLSLLNSWLILIGEALACRSGMRSVYPMTKTVSEKRSSQDLMRAIAGLQKTISYAQSNVSPAAICGYLAWELR